MKPDLEKLIVFDKEDVIHKNAWKFTLAELEKEILYVSGEDGFSVKDFKRAVQNLMEAEK